MDPLTVPNRPLCVDMDGTLLETDTMTELVVSFLRAGFWRSGLLLIWLLRGRAYFKRRLADEAVLRVELLPAHPEFLKYLGEQSAAGRTLVLVSAADEATVRRVAARFKFFTGAIGSDGKTNLRGEAKLRRLTELYGPKGFDYAGNSSVDIPVWRGAAEAIVVNARRSVEHQAREVATVSGVFPPHTGRWELLAQMLRRQSRKF
jgi:phosphoserine phosphatase